MIIDITTENIRLILDAISEELNFYEHMGRADSDRPKAYTRLQDELINSLKADEAAAAEQDAENGPDTATQNILNDTLLI